MLWLRPDGAEMKDEDWNFPEGRFLAYVLAAADDGGEPLFIVFNAAPEGDRSHAAGLARRRALGLACSTPPRTRCWPSRRIEAPGAKLTAPPASILAFAGKP